MTRKITSEMQIQINELYATLGVKSQVAKLLGISAASVTRYIIPNYIPQNQREIEIFSGEIATSEAVVNMFINGIYEKNNLKILSEMEWQELKRLQKEEI